MATRMIKLAEALAKQWMPGFRQGPKNRRAWEHPQDLVRLLDERPGDYSAAGQMKAKTMAWLHDVLEDGVAEDGRRIVEADLRNYSFDYVEAPDGGLLVPEVIPDGACLSPEVIEGVVQLTHKAGHTKDEYYQTLAGIDYIPKLVKCVDRVCNLREGAETFKPARWTRYVADTRKYVLPLTSALSKDTDKWLHALLCDAMALRPSSPFSDSLPLGSLSPARWPTGTSARSSQSSTPGSGQAMSRS